MQRPESPDSIDPSGEAPRSARAAAESAGSTERVRARDPLAPADERPRWPPPFSRDARAGAGGAGMLRAVASAASALLSDLGQALEPVDPWRVRAGDAGARAEVGAAPASPASPAAADAAEASGARGADGASATEADLAAFAILVAPVSGRALVYPTLPPGGLPLAPGEAPISLEVLCGEPASAQQYAGGGALVVRVDPQEAASVGFPAAGMALRARRLAPHAARLGVGGFARVLSYAFGDLAILELASAPPGYTYDVGPVRADAPRGRLAPGGGAVIVLIDPGRVRWDADLVEASAAGVATRVRRGEPVGRRAD